MKLCALKDIFAPIIKLVKYYLYILFLFTISLTGFSQTDTARTVLKPTDSTPHFLPDTIINGSAGISNKTASRDTLLADSALVIIPVMTFANDTLYKKLLDNPFLRMTGKPTYLVIKEKVFVSKDEMFYLIAGLLIFLAFIKLVFNKYFQNIFKLLLQPSFRQKQTREQLSQNSLPALLLNIFFILATGTYITLLLHYFNISAQPFWRLYIFTTLALTLLYVGKYLFLSFAGWVFNVANATETYTFVVYLINKIIAVVLVPVILMLAFSSPPIAVIAVALSFIIVFSLLMYRFIVAIGSVRREVNVSPLHFIFFVFAFEVTPLLLIYKTLIIYLHNSI